MGKFKISDIANLLKVAQMTVYRKVKKLKKELSTHSFKEKGVLFFDSEGLEIIRKAISTAPVETTLEALPGSADLSPMISRFGDVEKCILALTEAFKGEMKSLREDNLALKREVASLRGLLEAPRRTVPAQTTPRKEAMNSSEFQSHQSDPREVVSSQRKISAWESIQLAFDDCLGLLFGRG